MSDFFEGHYDETPIENQKWQFKYVLKKDFRSLLFTENLTPEQRHWLDILHHGTEEQIKQLAKIN